jgi:serine/threonine-protein kinase
MSDLQSASGRPRTGTRLRGVVPAGFAPPEPVEGVKTIGRYEVIKVLGKGAMGVVYKGRDPLLDRIVAVKTIVAPDRVGKRSRSAYLERFQREAKAAAKMQHPAIVTIFDVGLEGNAPFMVLEYLPGESLADRLDKVRLPLFRAVNIARDLAGALSFAHRQRIVHRDVKPANVLHAGEDRWKLADFGIARLPNSDLTQAGIFMGTPGYAPPEAIREGQYTPQADVFAWGAVLYEMLSGRIPYEGPDTPTTNGYVLRATARTPRVYDPSIPEPLAEVVMTALAPDPATRYKDADAAEHALAAAWDRCLNEGLVHTSVLTMSEKPHAEVRGPMHVGGVSKPPSNSGVTPRDTVVGPPPVMSDEGGVVIAAKGAVASDSEPTTLIARDRDTPAPRGAPQRAGEDSIVIADDFDARSDADILAKARATASRASQRANDTANMEPLYDGTASAAWSWVMLILLAIMGGAVTAYLVWGAR